MIGEREIYHGVALARLIQDGGQRIDIASWSSISRSAYVLDDSMPLYIKYSTKRLSPWSFEFSADHAGELRDLAELFGEVWVVLVCGPVGVVAESWSAVSRIASARADDSFSLAVNWRPNHKYRLSGAGSKPLMVSDSAFPRNVLQWASATQGTRQQPDAVT